MSQKDLVETRLVICKRCRGTGVIAPLHVLHEFSAEDDGEPQNRVNLIARPFRGSSVQLRALERCC